jgi:DNA-binding transcriptional ArsR family regulator
MIETLISSKTRIKLLLKFFLNSETKSYLRHLESEFGESTNAIRLELNKLEEAGMLNSQFEGNKKIYQANKQHPLFNDINSIILKYTGIDWIVEYLVKRLGDVKKVY